MNIIDKEYLAKELMRQMCENTNLVSSLHKIAVDASGRCVKYSDELKDEELVVFKIRYQNGAVTSCDQIRKIKAHKDGRKARIDIRVTDKEKELVDSAKENLSYSDFLVKKAKDVLRRRKK